MQSDVSEEDVEDLQSTKMESRPCKQPGVSPFVARDVTGIAKIADCMV